MKQGSIRGALQRFRRQRASDTMPAPAPARERRSVSDAIREAFGKDAYDNVTSPSTQMSVALAGKPTYEGTVAKAVVQRRAANKRARQARAMHRRAAR